MTSAWLADDHIDLAMELLRDRAQRYPRSYDSPGRVILSSEFVRIVDIEHHELLSKGNECILSEYMLELVIGLQPRCEKPWTDCAHMYIPVIANSHCFSVEIVFANSTMYVYDSDHNCLRQSQLEQILESMAVIVPMMASQAMIRVNDRLAIVRNMTTAKQERSGDCGLFAIKYIEFLSIGRNVDIINQSWIDMWRHKLACDLYEYNCDP
ncbi:uncharacterized protein LOC111366914 [Olea europaea var. sylvestris]|uniref:uncharacterized protein LOC111366914 n=1 Tax=Olea europaea var. sylvestris TaxID=158386 RepID=UPI000C1D0B65|nr:uncharacterized protein LOC111366914 [Olea europaea var. sylvestris]